MNIILSLEEYNDNNVYFFEKIKNNIIINGFFIRIIYSSSFFSLNTILLDVLFVHLRIEQNKCYDNENNNKIKYFIDTVKNEKTIERLKFIEYNILKKVNIPEKTPVYKLQETLKNGYIKIFDKCFYLDNNSSLNTILKISGIWISEKNFGLSYKFIHQ